MHPTEAERVSPRCGVSLLHPKTVEHLHRSVANNIVFCFTNARGTQYRPGDTLLPLRTLLNKLKEDWGIQIAISEPTVYNFDNEAFRYLCAIRNNLKLKDEQRSNFVESFEKFIH